MCDKNVMRRIDPPIVFKPQGFVFTSIDHTPICDFTPPYLVSILFAELSSLIFAICSSHTGIYISYSVIHTFLLDFGLRFMYSALCLQTSKKGEVEFICG